jgi:hypothetical protein
VRHSRFLIGGAALGLALAAGRVGAQTPVLLQGLVDGEFSASSGTSNLLTRNGGRPAGLGRLQLWGAVEPLSGLVFYAQGMAQIGKAGDQSDRYYLSAQQYGARYTASRALTVDLGQLTPVVGAFAARNFSNRNPLIGSPDAYSLEYPLGAEVSGQTTHFDYRAAIVSKPVAHDVYVPDPGARFRPAAGVGFTPFIGAHLGASFTVGPYLNDSFTASQLANRTWTSYDQRITALDAAFARGYLELHAEFARAAYDVPRFMNELVGYTYYGEAKYTFTPRFFLAGRVERNDYPFIRAVSPTIWVGKLTDFVDGEIGAGYRLTSSTLLKLSVRGDRWWVKKGAAGFLGQGGGAFGVQLSQSFDAMDWFTRER